LPTGITLSSLPNIITTGGGGGITTAITTTTPDSTINVTLPGGIPLPLLPGSKFQLSLNSNSIQ
jgi:hypothetical protein